MARILLNFRSGFPGLREGFEALGHEVLENLWTPEAAALQGAALCVADFVDCARGVRRTLGLRARLARAGVPFVALSRDAPWNRGVHRTRLAVMAWLRPFDGYAAHSMQGAERFSDRILYSANAARESLYQVNEQQLRAMRDPVYFRWDVSFFGNLNAVRYPEHARRAELLGALESKLAPLGIRTRFRDSAGMTDAEQVETIKRSRINLSAGAACDAGGEASWGLPERCYGVPACGGFLLSDRRRHAPEDFAAEEWADYQSVEDCAAKIGQFLEQPERARDIAERALLRVARDHGYRNRAERLLDFARDAR